MSQLTVTDHHLDPLLDVYRLTVGYVEEVEVPVLDERGEPVYEPGETIRTPRIRPKLDENGQPTGETYEDPDEVVEQVARGKAVTEKVLVSVPVEDFVFSRFDERWAGATDEQIVKEQRRLVRSALRKRERAAAADAAAAGTLVSMPGIGEGL